MMTQSILVQQHRSVDTYSSNNDKKNEGDMDPKSNRVQKKTDKKE